MSETKIEYLKPQKSLFDKLLCKAHCTNFALIIFCTVKNRYEFQFVLITDQRDFY